MKVARNKMKNLSILFIILLILSQFSPNVVSDAEKDVLYVDDDNVDGPWDGSLVYPYQHIQDALNDSSDGDTVFVFNGTYTELVTIETEVALIGEDNSATILEYIRKGTFSIPNLITISTDNVVVEKLCIRQDNSTIQHNLRGIYCTESDGILIQQNTIENCERSIVFEDSSGNVLDNFISFNGQDIGVAGFTFSNPTQGSELIISNNTIINYTYGIVFYCPRSGPSQIVIDNNLIESSAGEQPSIEDSGGIRFRHLVDQNYHMSISHNVITGFHKGFYYKENAVWVKWGSNLNDSSVDIFSNTFNNTENDLFLYPNSRWSKEILTITKNNFYGQNNNQLFLEILTLDPTILQYTSMIHKSLIEWNNNYWVNHSADEAVKIPGRMVVWLSYRLPADILRIPIYQIDPDPADEPFEV